MDIYNNVQVVVNETGDHVQHTASASPVIPSASHSGMMSPSSSLDGINMGFGSITDTDSINALKKIGTLKLPKE